jgi:aspartate carbamoyltransferase catalytic subunit
MKDDIKEYLTGVGVDWEEVDDLAKVAADVDVLYQTRIQKERFQDRCGPCFSWLWGWRISSFLDA